MKIFSTFSGIGGFELGIIQAFWKENVELVGYSELDKFSFAVLAYRFPGVKNHGDITKIDFESLPDFDVLVGGSPCQDLSTSKENRQGLMGSRSGLFFEYVRLLRVKKTTFFVLENVVSMKNDDRDFISETLGVKPIKINSALFTAQSRNRYYWTNIPNIPKPKDKGITLADTLEPSVDEKYFVEWQNRTGKKFYLTGLEIPPCTFIEARTELGYEERKKNRQLFGIAKESRNKNTSKYIAKKGDKSNCLTGTIRRANLLIVHKKDGFGLNKLAVRMPTPIECERLQGFPDNWTLVSRKNKMMSDTQRYKQTWNAITVDVIQHIFEALKKHLQISWSINTTTLKVSKDAAGKAFVAYYCDQRKRSWSLWSQQTIIRHFVQLEAGRIIYESTESASNPKTALQSAIRFCQKHAATLIIANLNVLQYNVDLVFKVKKKLSHQFQSCDLPTSDRLPLVSLIEPLHLIHQK